MAYKEWSTYTLLIKTLVLSLILVAFLENISENTVFPCFRPASVLFQGYLYIYIYIFPPTLPLNKHLIFSHLLIGRKKCLLWALLLLYLQHIPLTSASFTWIISLTRLFSVPRHCILHQCFYHSLFCLEHMFMHQKYFSDESNAFLLNPLFGDRT